LPMRLGGGNEGAVEGKTAWGGMFFVGFDLRSTSRLRRSRRT
jgi:hypothetical protein